jgi:glycosyltransferase involved in cell wall biosynthesis
MADRPRFSITVPAYNAEATLAETVASVKAQTFDDWELVIVDDGSTDGTLTLARSLAVDDRRIRVVAQENRGSGGAYNTAVRNATSDLIVMLSADDLLLPDHLASFDAFIRANPGASVFTCDGWYLYDDGRREPADPAARWGDPSVCTLEDLLGACLYGVGAVYRRAVFDAVGGFREDFYAEDYLFWLLALARGFVHAHLDTPLSIHRRNDVQKSADAIRMRRTDVMVVDALLAAGLLSAAAESRALGVRRRLERDIRIRRGLYSLLGVTVTERLIAATRPRRWRTANRRLDR